MKFKEIKLHPTEFSLDIYITDNKYNLEDIFKERYGAPEDVIDTLGVNTCLRFETDINSVMKGNRTFVIILESLNPSYVVHECMHLLWQLSDLVGIEINQCSQEWQALFMEYLTSEILKDDYNERN